MAQGEQSVNFIDDAIRKWRKKNLHVLLRNYRATERRTGGTDVEDGGEYGGGMPARDS